MKKTKEIQIYIKDEETFLSTYYNENYKKLLGNCQFYHRFLINPKLSMFIQPGLALAK